jgi:hypothetical protein
VERITNFSAWAGGAINSSAETCAKQAVAAHPIAMAIAATRLRKKLPGMFCGPFR